jgi:hypothetical protein
VRSGHKGKYIVAAYKSLILDVLEMHKDGNSPVLIARALGIDVEQVEQIIRDYS